MALGINGQQHQFTGLAAGEINHPHTTGLARPGAAPAQLAHPAGARHQHAFIGTGSYEGAKPAHLIR